MNPKDFYSINAGKVILTSTGYWTFLPNSLPPNINWSSSLVSTLSDAERNLGRLSSIVESFPFPQLIIQPFIRQEAVISSRIEGTHASLTDLYSYESKQLSFFEKFDDVREVYNYVEAMVYAMERLKALPVSLRLIRELHKKLLANVRGNTLSPGEFRRTQNWVGPIGSSPSTAPYVPPPVEEMHHSLDLLEKFIHTRMEIPALIKIGLIHYQFEAIHPFLDGNGRVGRLLVDLLLFEWGLLSQPVLNLSAYIDRYRQQYYDLLLSVSQDGTWENWLSFFLKGISIQAKNGAQHLEQLRDIRKSYQYIIEQDRNHERMTSVIEYLFSRPVFSVKQVANELDVPFKTANYYINKLEQEGILREITGFERNRIFKVDKIIQIITSQE